MKICPMTYRYIFFDRFRAILLYVLLIGAVAVTVPSCTGSKKSSSMRKIERESKKDYRGKEEKKAEKEQEKKRQEAIKASEKARQDGITRHREFQTDDIRDRMDEHSKASDEKYKKKKEFFLVRWFKPKDDIEKIEKRRAKEVEQRMAATRKKADKNNEERGATHIKTGERKASKPDPSDIQHGGGGSYQEGKSKTKVRSSDFQHGGGGDMSGGKTKKIKPGSEGGNIKNTSPRKNPFSKKEKPKAGD